MNNFFQFMNQRVTPDFSMPLWLVTLVWFGLMLRLIMLQIDWHKSQKLKREHMERLFRNYQEHEKVQNNSR